MKLLLVLFSAVATVASAQATYTYTGHPFNSVASWPTSFYPPVGTYVTATVTLPMALPKGATTCITSIGIWCSSPAINLNGFSWRISDGVNVIFGTYPSGPTRGILMSLTFTTDSDGNIIDWNMDATRSGATFQGMAPVPGLEIRTTHEPAPGFENDSDLSSIELYLSSISSDPGTWTVKDPPAPVVLGGTGYGSIAAGGIATIHGDFAGFPTASGLSSSLAGVQVGFPDVIGGGAPLYYVSPTQITFQVPWELASHGSQQIPLSVSMNGTVSANLQLSALPSAAPGIFEMNPQHQAAALDTAYHLVGADNPAAAGSVISIYCTGLGAVTVPQTDGIPAPVDAPAYTRALPTVTIGGRSAQVEFSGLTPGSTGLYQINVVVPNLPPGPQPVTIMMLNVTSNTVMLSVR